MQAIQIISTIVALLTTVIILFTLLEMKIQRRSTYKPDIFSKGTRFYIYWVEDNKLFLPMVWSTVQIANFKNIDLDSFIYIDLANIGLASAKNIKISWETDLDLFFDIINKVDTKNNFNFNINHTNNSLSIKSLKPSFSYKFSSLLNFNHTIGYLLPANSINEQHKLAIPDYYNFLCSIYICLIADDPRYEKKINRTKKSLMSFLEIDDPPPLLLKISYKDIENKKHKKVLNLKYHFYKIDPLKGENTEASYGLIEIIDGK